MKYIVVSYRFCFSMVATALVLVAIMVFTAAMTISTVSCNNGSDVISELSLPPLDK